jgi:hypothetical protein
MAGAVEPQMLISQMNEAPSPRPEAQRVTGLEVLGIIVKHPSGKDVILTWDEEKKRFRVGELADFKFELEET